MSSRSLGTLTIDLVTKLGGFSRGLDKAGRELDTKTRAMQKRMEQVGRGIGKALAVSFGVGTAALGLYIRNTIEAEKVQAQLASRIRDTGGAAGRTLQQLSAQADKLQSLTIFDDESIGEAQAALLTFRNVVGETFDRTIEAATDLATVMGTDVPSAAKLLGKALADPVAGLGALRKAGVVLSEDQKYLVKALQEAGDVAGAQKIILDELARTMGTAAEASRDTLGGALQGLKNAFNNMLEGDSGSDGARGAKEAVNQLAATMNSADVKSGFNSMVTGLAEVAKYALNAIATADKFRIAIADAFADANQMTYDGLVTHRQQLEEDLAAVEKGPLSALKQLYFGRGVGEVGKDNISLLESDQENAARLRAELDLVNDRLERLRALRSVPMGDAATSPDGTGAVQTLGGMVIRPPTGGGGGSSKAEREREAAAERRKREMEEAAAAHDEFLRSLQDLRAEMEGPLQQVELEYIRREDEIIALKEKGIITGEEQAKAFELLEASRQKEVDAINAQLTPLESLIEDQKKQLALMGLTGAALETEAALYGKTAEERARYGAEVRKNFEDLEAAQESLNLRDTMQQDFESAFASIVDGSKSAKEAFADLAKSIIADLAKIAIHKWATQLFENFWPAAGGGAAPTGSAMGNVFEHGELVPFAKGGVVRRQSMFGMADGNLGIMSEGDRPEAIMPLERDSSGRLGVRAAGGGGMTQVNNFYIPEIRTLRSQEQVAQRSADRMTRAVNRNR